MEEEAEEPETVAASTETVAASVICSSDMYNVQYKTPSRPRPRTRGPHGAEGGGAADENAVINWSNHPCHTLRNRMLDNKTVERASFRVDIVSTLDCVRKTQVDFDDLHR